MNEKIYYVLYGGEAISIFENNGCNDVLKEAINNGLCFSLKKYNSKDDNVVTILQDSDGWYGYMFLTKEQYDYIMILCQ